MVPNGLHSTAILVIQNTLDAGTYKESEFNSATLYFLDALYGQVADSSLQINKNLIQRWARHNVDTNLITPSAFLYENAFSFSQAKNTVGALTALGALSECQLDVTVPESVETAKSLVDLGFSISDDALVEASMNKLVSFDAFVHWRTRLALEGNHTLYPRSDIGFCHPDEVTNFGVDQATIDTSALVLACQIPADQIPADEEDIYLSTARFYSQTFFAPLPYQPHSSKTTSQEKGANLMTSAQTEAFADCNSQVREALQQTQGLSFGQISQSDVIAELAAQTEVGSVKPIIEANTETISANGQAIATNTKGISANAAAIAAVTQNIATFDEEIATNAINIDSNTESIADLQEDTGALAENLKAGLLIAQSFDERLTILEKKVGAGNALVISSALPLTLVGTATYLFL